jgi:DNA mismatch repair protein MutL
MRKKTNIVEGRDMVSNKINILTEEVIGKISAGEVVERPASVVKELVENSIDAESDSIEVEIQSAGQTLIRVADNGEGMNGEEVKRACMRHATSKIKEADDLDDINSLGFRGEALSSIAAVSQMDLTSCAKGDDSGVYVYLESGEALESRPAGRSRGTTVEVRNIFYNVPARRKFLKKESTELAEIVNVVGRFIISYPDIEFKLTQEDRCLLHATREMGLSERIRLVLGGDFADHMVDLSDASNGFEVNGYVSRPSCTRRDKRAQVFFVNGRFVRSKILSDAVYVAYRSMLERGRYPSVVLFLRVSPQEVDVNVHPTKLEVKFSNDNALKNTVIRSIKDKFDEARSADPDFMAAPVGIEKAGIIHENPLIIGDTEDQTEFVYDYQEKEDKTDLSQKDKPAWTDRRAVLGEEEEIFQVADCYIVQLKKDGITITDQHAAHERILYEFFSKSSEESPIEAQNLLFPVRIDLSAAESVVMEKVMEDFSALGFRIEPFGERSVAVQAVPAVLKDRDVKTVVYDVLSDLSSLDLAKVDPVEEIVKLTSCRAAIKAGDRLTREEMISLFRQLNECDLPFTCPHGRPTMTKIMVDDLEKMFRRK